MTAEEQYFNTEAERLSSMNYNLYSDENKCLSEDGFAALYNDFKAARSKFRKEYYLYAQSVAKAKAQDEFEGEKGKKYTAKLDKAGIKDLLIYQQNANHNFELYEEWADKYPQGGQSSFSHCANTSERIDLNDLKDLWFISLLKTEIDRRVCQANTQVPENKINLQQLTVETDLSDFKDDKNG